MPDRQIAPEVLTPQSLPSLHFEKHLVRGTLPVYMPADRSEDLLRISFVFDAGNIRSEAPALASAVNRLLLSGTRHYTSTELNHKLDLYGSYIELDHHHDDSAVNVFCMRKHAHSVLPLLEEVFTASVFPEEEIDIHRERSIENLKVNLEKTSFLAKRKCLHALFGNSPYGMFADIPDYEKVNRQDILQFYTSFYQKGLKYVLLNSWINPGIFENLASLALSFTANPDPIQFQTGKQTISLNKKESVQASIYMAMPFINRQHPDFMGLAVLNTVLGGYFGSRLMKNIREDKGYTYGIGSGIHSLNLAGYLSIKTDVGNDVKEKAVEEIFREINRLRNEIVPGHELQTVRNYMAGSLQRNFDGSLALCDRYKTILDFGLEVDHYNRYLNTILRITPEEILNLSEKYLKDDMISVVAGKHD